ncbi:MAG: FliH/SctL family protein [Planctomycetota bacterium]
MSTVIKAGQPGKVIRRLAAVDLADHLALAKQVVGDARREAAATVAAAKHQAERIRADAQRDGYDTGFAEGYEKGNREGRQDGLQEGHREALETATRTFNEQQSALVADMVRVVGEIDATRRDLEIAGRRHLLDFAIQLATKLTFAIGNVRSESALANLERALDSVYARTNLVIHANPKDLAAMERFAPKLLPLTESASGVRFVTDDSMAPGGCRVVTGKTEVDATLETQLHELVELLLGDASTGASDLPNPGAALGQGDARGPGTAAEDHTRGADG